MCFHFDKFLIHMFPGWSVLSLFDMFPIWLSDWYISGLICLFKTDNNSFPHHSNPWIQRCLFLILMLQLNLLVVCRYLLQLNIHLSLNPPLIVCRYPLQLNIHPSPFHWFVAYFCFSFRHSIWNSNMLCMLSTPFQPMNPEVSIPHSYATTQSAGRL